MVLDLVLSFVVVVGVPALLFHQFRCGGGCGDDVVVAVVDDTRLSSKNDPRNECGALIAAMADMIDIVMIGIKMTTTTRMYSRICTKAWFLFL